MLKNSSNEGLKSISKEIGTWVFEDSSYSKITNFS